MLHSTGSKKGNKWRFFRILDESSKMEKCTCQLNLRRNELNEINSFINDKHIDSKNEYKLQQDTFHFLKNTMNAL